jgi:hypothetical protein
MTDKKNDKKNDKRDRELGMSCSITRRDFLNGVALGMGGIPGGTAFDGLIRLERVRSREGS